VVVGLPPPVAVIPPSKLVRTERELPTEGGMAAGRLILAVAGAALAVLSLGAPRAEAASVVSFEEATTPVLDRLVVSGDDGVNDVTVGLDSALPTSFLITDSSGILDPVPPPCVRLSPTAVSCSVNTHIVILVELRGGEDRFGVGAGSIPQGGSLYVSGGEGSDMFRGRDGLGRDVFRGEGGNDQIFGLDGKDRLDGGPGADELDAGAGTFDRLAGGPDDDILTGGDGIDNLYGGPGVDILTGLAEDDTLLGEMGNDKLFGGAGADKGVGGPGRDSFAGGNGTDRGKAEREMSVER
jgi:Ca2+-binding RTX toxin-like protein